ncbi:hypothetical protein I79_002539 [Cricetulus griseus]|uniref:Uncharacterized protein n=1 Tax=Cricetulus griseus TaxID=10029 RepID=G3GXP7_CRIGR|nr:hypothetical protein I79_002539 [Cricetulus griseus]
MLIMSSQAGCRSFTDSMPLWDLDLGFTHSFALGGTILRGIFKKIFTSQTVFLILTVLT